MASDRNSEDVQQVGGQSGTSAEKTLPKSGEMKKNKEMGGSVEEDNADKTTENNRRLWVGNLSPKLTEGYAFITYNTPEDAKKCLEGLDGKKILDRVLSVRYAHQTTQAFMDEEERLRKKLPALGMKLEPEAKPVSKERTISAIEAKLRAMEREKDEVSNFSLTTVGSSQKTATRPQTVTRNYQYASRSANQYDATRNRTKPYSRYGPKKRF